MKKVNTVNSNGVKHCRVEHNSELARMERNDCVVRAISTLYDVNYNRAHAFVKKQFNRKDKDGTRGATMHMDALQEEFGKEWERLGIRYEDCITDEERENWPILERWNRAMIWPWKDKGEIKYAKYTVGKFLKENQVGSFYILVDSHAFAIINGVVYGNSDDATALRRRVESAFRIG